MFAKALRQWVWPSLARVALWNTVVAPDRPGRRHYFAVEREILPARAFRTSSVGAVDVVASVADDYDSFAPWAASGFTRDSMAAAGAITQQKREGNEGTRQGHVPVSGVRVVKVLCSGARSGVIGITTSRFVAAALAPREDPSDGPPDARRGAVERACITTNTTRQACG